MGGLLVAGLSTFIVEAGQEGVYTSAISDGRATITAFTSPGTVATNPDTLGGYLVTAIGNNAFENRRSLEPVVIGNGVTDSGEFACNGCTVQLAAFRSCTRLAAARPDSLETLRDSGYWDSGVFGNSNSPRNVALPNSGSGLWRWATARFPAARR